MSEKVSFFLPIKKTFFTLSIVTLCTIIYLTIGFISNFGEIDDKIYVEFGAPYASEIYMGQYWGLITNSFVHITWYHLAINILITYWLSSMIESTLGAFRLFVLGLSSAIVTSCFELFFTNDTGVGLLGVNFALYGFILTRNLEDLRFDHFPVKKAGFVLLALFILCNLMNLYFDWNFGILAMVFGFIWGSLVAWMYYQKWKKTNYTLLSIITLFCIITILYAPWSAEWNFAKGVKFHKKEKIELAEKYYHKALVINPKHELSINNLKLIKIDSLSEIAYEAHLKLHYIKARKLYTEILALDSTNQWAKENFNKLP